MFAPPMIPNNIRKLCSHQSIKNNGTSNISEFIRIWIPLILKRIGPNMRFQIIELFEYSLQKSINTIPVSSKIKKNIHRLSGYMTIGMILMNLLTVKRARLMKRKETKYIETKVREDTMNQKDGCRFITSNITHAILKKKKGFLTALKKQ